MARSQGEKDDDDPFDADTGCEGPPEPYRRQLGSPLSPKVQIDDAAADSARSVRLYSLIAALNLMILALGFRLVSAFLALCANLAFPLDRPLPNQSTVWGRPSPLWDATVSASEPSTRAISSTQMA